MMDREARLEAGRVVWRALKRAHAEGQEWVDEAFIGWPNMPPETLINGILLLEDRGHIDRCYDGKRPRVRLIENPAYLRLDLGGQ